MSSISSNLIFELREDLRKISICGKQNLAIRSNQENNSNFVAIPHMRTYEKAHTCWSSGTCRSSDIQNEIIGLCAIQIVSAIVKDCNNFSDYFQTSRRTVQRKNRRLSVSVFYDKAQQSVPAKFSVSPKHPMQRRKYLRNYSQNSLK